MMTNGPAASIGEVLKSTCPAPVIAWFSPRTLNLTFIDSRFCASSMKSS